MARCLSYSKIKTQESYFLEQWVCYIEDMACQSLQNENCTTIELRKLISRKKIEAKKWKPPTPL